MFVGEVNAEIRHILVVGGMDIVAPWGAGADDLWFPAGEASVSVLVATACSLRQTLVMHEKNVAGHLILEMMTTNCCHKAYHCIFVVSGQEKGLAYLCLHLLRREFEVVWDADVVYVDDFAGKEVVHEDYP